MITMPRRVRVHAYCMPTDLRRGFEGLSALVRQALHRDPLSGDLFLFVNRNLHRAKVLAFDGTGMWLLAKRLDKGRFACLWRDASRSQLEITASELQLFLEGSQLVGRVKLSPEEIGVKDLAIAIPR